MDLHEPPDLPPPPPFATSTELDPDSEIDVDLADDIDPGATVQEAVEFLGEYPTLEAYFRAQVEDLVDPAIPWLLDAVDWKKVQADFEAAGWRYVKEGAGIYRTGIPTPPDPMGPWMPTRGC